MEESPFRFKTGETFPDFRLWTIFFIVKIILALFFVKCKNYDFGKKRRNKKQIKLFDDDDDDVATHAAAFGGIHF